MKERRECIVIQDLLPNYLENLTNEETNKFIEEHLRNCEECKEVLESMKKEIKVNSEKPETKEVKFMKKYKRKIKILGGIILLIVILYVIFVLRNIIIISNLQNKANTSWNENNYHFRAYSHSGERITIRDIKYKDGKYIMKMDVLEPSGIYKILWHNDGNTVNAYYDNPGGKSVELNTKGMEISTSPHVCTSNIYELLVYSAISIIQKEKCNGVDSYFINLMPGETHKEHVSMETGLTLKIEDGVRIDETGTFDISTEYKYEFGTVTDEDLVPPNISEYEIR